MGERPPTKDMAGPAGNQVADTPATAPETAGTETVEPRPAEPAAHGRLEAHEHGRAVLAAAVDGNELTFTFEAPLASMVGFEHEPETEEEQAAIDALKDDFVVPGNMVSINREAACLPMMTTSGTHMTGDHGALEVEHVYTCEEPGDITRIDFLMMGDYPDLHSIEAVFVSDTAQIAGELSQDNYTLEVN